MDLSESGNSDSRELAAYRAELHPWLDAHHDELKPRFAPPGTLDDHVAQMQRVPGAPLARAETRIGLERLLDRMADIRISEAQHGPAGARRYEYVPTYILRGLTRLHLEFTPVGRFERAS